MKDFGLFPGDGGVMIDLFGTEVLSAIVARPWALVGKTEAQVFASPRDENGAIQRLAEGGFVAEGAIANGNEGLVFKTMGVKVLGAVRAACRQRPWRDYESFWPGGKRPFVPR